MPPKVIGYAWKTGGGPSPRYQPTRPSAKNNFATAVNRKASSCNIERHPLNGSSEFTASPRSGTPLYSVPDAPLVYCSLRSALASGDQGPPVRNVDHQCYATFRDCNARR